MKKFKKYNVLNILAPLGLLVLVGCGEDFAPPSYLDSLRVLALVSDPVEVSTGQTATITPYTYLPAKQTLSSVTWDFCPFSVGATAGYICAVPECLTPLTPASDGSVKVEPLKLALACAAKFAGSVRIPSGGSSGSLPESVETVVRYNVTSSSGAKRSAALRLLARLKPATSQNRNPVISRVEIGAKTISQNGTAAAVKKDAEVKVRTVVDPKSMDTFVDTAGRQRTETSLVSVFTTAGRFEYTRENGTDVTSTLKMEQLLDSDTEAKVYVVVRDLRGGQAVAGPFIVPISR